MYNTNCADGNDYRQNHDNRWGISHAKRYAAHTASVNETNYIGTSYLKKFNNNITHEGDL